MGDMNCSSVTVKYLIFIFNLLFVLVGIIFIAIGVSVKGYYSDYETFLDNQYFSAPNFLIAIGSIIFFIAFFGCCGAIRQSYCMLVTFTVFLCIIFIFEFSAAIAGYVLRGQTEEYLIQTLNESIPHYKPSTGTVSEITIAWDLIQNDFSCCGVTSYEDWKQNEAMHEGQLPMSCCKTPSGAINATTCNANDTSNIHPKGCATAFGEFVSDHAVSIGGVAMGFAILQLVAIAFAWYLTKQVRYFAEYA